MRPIHLLAGLCVLLGAPAEAVNWNFLEYSPVSRFTDQDFQLLRETGRAALDLAPDGDTRGWRNPESGAYGTVQPLRTYQTGDTTCRRVEIFNSAEDTSGTSRFDLCRQSDGTWKVAPQRPGPGPGGTQGG